MDPGLRQLRAVGLLRFQDLQADAIAAVTDRFYETHGSVYERFGQRGKQACREDLAFHLEFLRPVLEFGLLRPMVDYLHWLSSVLAARSIPAEHLAQSLRWLAEFFMDRMDVEDGAVVGAALNAARVGFLEAKHEPADPSPVPESWPEAGTFETAILAGNQREALSVLNACLDRGEGLVDVERHVIQPSLYQIGEKWQLNQVSVAQEHMATAIVQSVMTIGLLRSSPPATIDKRVLLACVEGNIHAIGLRMVADAFQLAGWDVRYLGANMPTRSLTQHVRDWTPDLVGLSVSFPQQLRTVREVIALLDEQLGRARPAVIVGGLAINRFDRLASLVGADAWRKDAAAAVSYAGRLR